MTDYIPVRLPVGDIAGFGPSPTVAGWLFAPRKVDPSQVRNVAFCLHGGGYDKRYFHIEVPGDDSYSMCRHFADRGVIAITIDWLGTSESSRAEAAENITAETLNKAHRVACKKLIDALKRGGLSPAIPALPTISLTGIGHSMGGMFVTLQQAQYRSFDRVAVLGWSNLGLNLPPSALKAVLDETGKYAYSSAELRREFHMSDVPPAVLDCSAERDVAPVSVTLAAQTRDRDTSRAAAGRIEVPVFVSYGEKDVSPAPRDEIACFTSSNDVTFFALPRSAHCHNFASTRTVLWDRILQWMELPV